MRLIQFLLIFFLISCSGSDENTPVTPTKTLEIKGADLSFLPEVRSSGIAVYNAQNQAEDMLTTLKNAGVNTIRLRLWKNPSTSTSNFLTVKTLTKEIQSKGMKVLLTVHYSDSWADPSQQTKPTEWNSLTFIQLQDAVYNYTKQIITEINPDYIQIGNEINNGFLWNEGNISNFSQFKTLLQKGISAVRETNSKTKIILQFAGHEDANSFFSKISNLDYDIIGLSYYPMWHGKSLTDLQQNLTTISNTQNKPIFIAETSYPFTLNWNDYTNNIIGLNSQILPEFPATETGQKDYLNKIKSIVTAVPKGIGFCYWGTEWISYKGATATNGSPYENQAFWDFNYKALPVLEVYK